MEGTAYFHHKIASIFFENSTTFLHNSTTFHTTVHVFNANSAFRYLTVRLFLLFGQLFTFGFFHGHNGFRIRYGKTLKPQILEQLTSIRQRIGTTIRQTLIMNFPGGGLAQKEYLKSEIHKEKIFYGVPFFLPAIEFLLNFLVSGTRDWSLDSVVAKRGLVFSPESISLCVVWTDITNRFYALLSDIVLVAFVSALPYYGMGHRLSF